ncbi:MAG: DegQ family serine endoprotease [Calditrichaceae bacterium]|nr:DegQ family serine endoprotease [Calditrichia bacterium]NUQ43252.1 DegQ family serine endoprotease [Calditrichaceae bacterium]
MNKKRLTGFSIVLVLAGIVMGLILASGLNWTGHLTADSPDQPKEEGGITQTSPGAANLDGQSILNALSNAFSDVAEKVTPSVVTISTETVIKGRQVSPYWFPFDDFFGQRMPEREFTQQGLGSGVIVQADGVILTNNHVVDKADNIVVKLMDGRQFKAEVKGTDSRTDLAVLKIEASSLPAISIGNSDAVRVGEWVLAVGSPLQEEFAHTVTSGIVSAKGRTGVGLTQYEDFIQTDAAINPGNSGGALVNLKGELIGINTAIASRSGGNIGIGFAIPANLANKVMSDILTKGKVVRGWLGVQISNITPDIAKMYGLDNTSEGVFIREVVKDSPAEAAGLQAGDIVLEVSGKKVRNATELSTLIGSTDPRTAINLKVLRDGKQREINVKLAEFPEEEPQIAGNQRQNVESLGLRVENVSPELRRRYDLSNSEGVVITSVAQGSVAARVGLQEGDVITRLNRQNVRNMSEFNRVIADLKPGDPVILNVLRGDRRFIVNFNLPQN